ncbi:unnamed protein product [Auanema sp. JU1783]|nr:unnamed protein product [Auanema sp. JU1783]
MWFPSVLSIFYLCLLLPVHGKILKAEVVSSQSFIRKELRGLNELLGLQFTVFGSLFELALHRCEPPIQANCVLKYSQNNAENVVRVHELGIADYVGKVIGDNRSRVNLMDSLKLYYGTIQSEKGNIIFRPVLPSDAHSNQGDILFMLVDEPVNIAPEVLSPIRTNHTSCKRSVPFISSRETHENKSVVEPHKLNRCNVRIVVDSNYAKDRDLTAVYSYVNTMMEKVNEIFTRTDFDEGYSDNDLNEKNRGRYVGMGMQVISIDILKDNHSNNKSFEYSGDILWNMSDLRDSFVLSSYCNNTCICHLITGKMFIDSQHLGVSDTASPNTGICNNRNAVVTRAADNFSDYNSLKSYLVAAHEYAHLWGSDHDDFSEIDSLLRSYQVNGYKDSHYTFSPDSKKNISDNISDIENNGGCFVERSKNICGNGYVEKSEECDSGDKINDACCMPNCTFAANARCSPLNHACCTEDCKLHNTSRKCYDSVPELCEDNTYCNGFHANCPPTEKLHNTTCYGNGTCMNGTCISFCEMNKKQDCTCTGKNVCLRCCRDKDGVCSPEADLLRSDHENCGMNMICMEGACVLVPKAHFPNIGGYSWTVFSFLMFIVVTCIFILSSFLVYTYDKEQMKKPEPAVRYSPPAVADST